MGSRRVVFALFGALALVTAGCAGDDAEVASSNTTEASGPSVAITSPADGATIQGNVVSLALDVKGIEIVKADGDLTGATGHIHVFIDTEPVPVGEAIGKTPTVIHSADNPVVVPGLSVGEHTLTVVLGNGAHTRLSANTATIKVNVAGPAIDATAPATIKAGEDLSIDVAVEGLTLVKADGDTSGATGHLHAFVDTPPVAPGEVIPTGNPLIIHSAVSPIVVTGLAPGEHVIWLVAGDGTHTALKNSARDKVTVTVS